MENNNEVKFILICILLFIAGYVYKLHQHNSLSSLYSKKGILTLIIVIISLKIITCNCSNILYCLYIWPTGDGSKCTKCENSSDCKNGRFCCPHMKLCVNEQEGCPAPAVAGCP